MLKSLIWIRGSISIGDLWCRGNAQTIQNIIGALVVSAMFIGTSNASTVQPVVDTERTVFYR